MTISKDSHESRQTAESRATEERLRLAMQRLQRAVEEPVVGQNKPRVSDRDACLRC